MLQGARVPELCFPARVRSGRGVSRFGTHRCPGAPSVAPRPPRSACAQAKSQPQELCLPKNYVSLCNAGTRCPCQEGRARYLQIFLLASQTQAMRFPFFKICSSAGVSHPFPSGDQRSRQKHYTLLFDLVAVYTYE